MWVLFSVPCPTPDGQTARDLYEKRLTWITDDMRASARELGCRFHRAWYAQDGSAFYALANWGSLDDAQTFFDRWDIRDEPARSRSPCWATWVSCRIPDRSDPALARRPLECSSETQHARIVAARADDLEPDRKSI